ncbi:hypothetical protein [Sphingomonas sp.]|nr:hypothetical protein [Sphingomonas sp.]
MALPLVPAPAAADPDGKPCPARGWFNIDWRRCESARCLAPDTGE